jgi:DNA polymerase I-like protein with 3'-5' exonuclease and polymerase domains
MLTGFICKGLKKKNEIINYAVQGSAFHCLLWALIRIVLFEIKKRRRLKSLIVGQIHDSLVGDVRENEVESFKEMVIEVLTELLPEEWKWIIVPLVVEIAVYQKSWAEKD